MNRWLKAQILLVLLLLLPLSGAHAQSLDKTSALVENLRRNATLLIEQRQRQSATGVNPLGIAELQASGISSRNTSSASSLLPFALQLGSQSSARFLYARTSADQASRDPIAASLQGFGLTGNYGAVKSDSQFYFYNPKLDGGAAATLVHDYHQSGSGIRSAASQLQGGQAFKQNLQMHAGTLNFTGLYQDISKNFAPAQRLVSGDSDDAKRLQEMLQQRGTQRTALGLTAGVTKGLTLAGSYDALNDGDGQMQINTLGLTNKLFKISTRSQKTDAGFKGFKKFADADIQKLEGQSGVQRNELQWALTPSKTVGLEGARNLVRDASGQVATSTLGLHLGAFQFNQRKRAVSGFQSFGALSGDDKALQKIVGVSLQETNMSLGLGGKTRLGFAETRISDAGGESSDRLLSFDSRTLLASARFREVGNGFNSYNNLTQYDKQYKGLDQHRGQREALYDLNYVGSKWLGLTNHFEQIQSLSEGNDGWTRTNWGSTLNLNLGRTTAQAYRAQTTVDTANGNTVQNQERYQLRRALTKDGFFLAERQAQTDQDIQGRTARQQTDHLQTRLGLQKGGFFFAEHLAQKAQNVNGNVSWQQTDRLQTRLGLQKDGFLFAEHLTQNAQDLQGNVTRQQTDQLQTKLQVANLFALDGQRIERRGASVDGYYQDKLNLSRSIGKLAAVMNYRDSNDENGFVQANKLSLSGNLTKHLALTSSREMILSRAFTAAGQAQAPLQRTVDQRWTLTQDMGKGAKLNYAFARLTTDDSMRGAEQALSLQTPLRGMALTADFTQRQAAGKQTTVVQGFTLADETKKNGLSWRCQYRRRSESIGQPLETKGISGSYESQGKGKLPLTLTASYLRNAEDAKGIAHAGRQAGAKLTTSFGGNLNLTVDYNQNMDEIARKAQERTGITMNGVRKKDEKWEVGLSTQRTFEPAGDQSKRTRENTIHFKYGHVVGDAQAFELGADLTFRTNELNGRSHSADYLTSLRWVRSF